MILTALLFTSVFAFLLFRFFPQLAKLNQEDSIIYVVFVLLGYIATFFMPQVAMNKSLLYSVEQRTQIIIKQSENVKHQHQQNYQNFPRGKPTSLMISDDSTVEDHQDDAMSSQHQAMINHLKNGGETYEERQSILYRMQKAPEY
jgi:hypothetical protein